MSIVSTPPVFRRFDTDLLTGIGGTLRPDEPPPCHFVVEGLTDDQLWGVFEPVSVPEGVGRLSICENGIDRPATLKEILEIKAAFVKK